MVYFRHSDDGWFNEISFLIILLTLYLLKIILF